MLLRTNRVRSKEKDETRLVRTVPDLSVAGASSIRARFTGNLVGFDTEGTGLIPYGPPTYWGYYPARPFAFSFCDDDGNEAWIRLPVDPATRRVKFEEAKPGEIEALRFFLASEKYIKVGHNISYDLRMVQESGFEVRGEVHDTMVLSHVVTAGDLLSYALKPVCKRILNYPDDDEKILEDAVREARREARARNWLIAGGKKEVEKGERVVFAGNKPVKADYWLVPFPDAVTDTPHDLVREYGMGDAVRAMALFLYMWKELESDARLRNTYEREMATFYALRRMERRGTRVYPSHTQHLTEWYRADMARQVIVGDAEGGFLPNKKGEMVRMNYNSHVQLKKKFGTERGFTAIMVDRKRKNKITGEEYKEEGESWGKDALAILGSVDEETGEPKDKLAKAILEWRAGRQTISSFLNIYGKFWYPSGVVNPAHQARYDKIIGGSNELKRLRPRDLAWLYIHAVWILHPNYNQTGAVTGRMTCSDPNLQQVASATTGLRKSDIPQRPRECFGPRPGCVWYLPDYSQIEVWLFAFMSGEQAMQRLLLSGHDFHQGVADRSFTSRPDYTVRKKYYRKLAKLIMFGKLYGGGVGSKEKPGRMTKLLQMPFEEAKLFIDSFEDQFAAVKEFMDDMIQLAKENGEAWNLFDRKYVLEREWAYKVVNYLIQGTAADVLKMAIIRLDWFLRTRWPHPHLCILNSIHDEKMIEVPYELHSVRLMREMAWVMQMDSAHCGIPVPLPVGMKVTQRMYSMRERAYVQRWSDTVDIQIRPDWVIARHKANGIVECKPDIQGGVPFFPEEEAYFADLAAHMATCPHNRYVPKPRLVQGEVA